jgi:hypothetical protein
MLDQRTDVPRDVARRDSGTGMYESDDLMIGCRECGHESSGPPARICHGAAEDHDRAASTEPLVPADTGKFRHGHCSSRGIAYSET